MRMATRWDIFCRVVDNYGDIGVCWRLGADLATRGDSVRLWIDDPSALAWMAPGALQGRWDRIQVFDWKLASEAATLSALAPSDGWIEAFGCDIPVPFLAHHLQDVGIGSAAAPAWINLEYLSAESFARRSHRLPSPVLVGVATGSTKHFYYPGFTPDSGGLLREPDLARRRADFDRARWLSARGIAWHGEQLVSLFCYEPVALAAQLAYWRTQPRPTRLLVTDGRAAAAVRALAPAQQAGATDTAASPALSIDFLQPLTQRDFDHLLWACDLNFVRGEDSVVRALWAAKPFIWQIYPQQDDAHHAKLQALLDVLEAPQSLRRAHMVWNGISNGPMTQLDPAQWGHWATEACRRQEALPDLATRLAAFAAAIRALAKDAGGKG